MRVEIINSEKQKAYIYKINAITFDQNEFENPNNDSLPKEYRKYFFIDDVPDSLSEDVIEKFKILFEDSKLDCELYNGGRTFEIDTIKTKSREMKPRHGQDGGVVGINCP